MIKNFSSQKGSAHVIIIVGLIILLIGALGFIFWQNFLNHDADNASKRTVTSTNAGKETAQNEKTKSEYLTVKEWAVNIPQSPSSNVIEYTMNTEMTTATFVSSEQKAVGGECGTEAFARYRIVRIKQGQEPTDYMIEGQVSNAEASGNVVTIKGTRYYIVGDFSGGDCSGKLKEGDSMSQAEVDANANLKRALLALKES